MTISLIIQILSSIENHHENNDFGRSDFGPIEPNSISPIREI
jgi:hypothetical protein